MTRANLIDILYSKNKTALEFNFDLLYANPITCYLSQYDISALYNIATSIKYSGDINLKYREIDKIMVNRGFKKFVSGTNRVAYSFLEDQSIIMKVALDKVGLNDNPAEYRNQNLLKPFVTKVFDVSPCGTVGLFERVTPITRIQEFHSVANDVFDIITEKIIGKYVLDDIGTKYFMNWGVRLNVAPCLLDFPYVFELDGNKLICNKRDMTTGVVCGGLIDYNDGFNTLVCTKCGKEYKAKELETNKKEKLIIIEGDNVMKVKLVGRDGKVICNPGTSSDYIQKPNYTKKTKNNDSTLKVTINIESDQKDINETPVEKKGVDTIKVYEETPLDIKPINEDVEVKQTNLDLSSPSKFIPNNEEEEIEEVEENTKVEKTYEEQYEDSVTKRFLEKHKYDDEAPNVQKIRKGNKRNKNFSGMEEF